MTGMTLSPCVYAQNKSDKTELSIVYAHAAIMTYSLCYVVLSDAQKTQLVL